ncbi:DUF2332 domain-containing protein [Lysinibacillus sp. LK3]|uniref:DUF2332 domain-containing protein n=1 Tax=Lysinibacillus sp. LK3 TaxID=1628207 RepID=UPI000652FDF7|nr:DUF2332 domain-containing protein [Lysinibacillus sp. LK3]KMN38543.1 hypothetical protein VK91_17285 [Lysinibacillus sp. LK3]
MERLAKIFKRFSELEAQKSSPLYAYWSKEIAEDRELLTLMQSIPGSQPKPNMFFASVQYLAFKKNHPLKSYYSIFDRSENYLEASFFTLKEFVRLNEEALVECFQTKLVQTNELNRSSYLYPIFSEIAHKTEKPLTLIEIGTSAGLLLNLDHYKYEIKETEQILHFGDFESSVVVYAENIGKSLTAIKPFEVSERVGIDLNIVDLNKEEDYEWMQALIWPEQKDRKELLRKVSQLNKNISKKLYAGDFLQLIPSFIKNIDDGTQVIIFHTHVANQFNESLKINLLTMINNMSEQHPIYHVYNNMFDRHLHIDYITHSKTEEKKIIKEIDGHGKHYVWE